jgi:hypothetical protein
MNSGVLVSNFSIGYTFSLFNHSTKTSKTILAIGNEGLIVGMEISEVENLG